MFNKSKFKLSVYLILLALTASVGTWAIVTTRPQTNVSTVQKPTTQAQTPVPKTTELAYTAKAGMTSLQQLQDESDSVVVKDSKFGRYVDSIEGHRGGTDGKYWSFYINGELAQVGADSYMQKGGESIEWKFQKL